MRPPLHQLRQRLTPPPPWGWGILPLLCLLHGLVLALAARLIETQSLRFTLDGLTLAKVWYTALLLGLLTACLAFLLHSLFAGGALTALPAVLLAFVNYYKIAITSTPLHLSDLSMVRQVGHIAALNAPSLHLTSRGAMAILGTLVWLLVLLFLSKPLRLPWKPSALCALLPAALILGIFWAGGDRLVFTPLQAPLEQELMSQSLANDHCGLYLGLLRSGKVRSITLKRLAATTAQLDQMIAQDQAETVGLEGGREGVQPNVVVVLSESFFDTATLPGVHYEQDPLAAFRALQAEGVSGDFMTRTLGYGTCSIELEILTGINNYFLSPEYIYNIDPDRLAQFPSVPCLLGEAGYRTVLLHTFNDTIYNRQTIMEAIGFDECYFSDGFAAIDPQAAAAPDYWGYMSQHQSGTFYSDSYLADLIIQLDRDRGDRPLFTFAISMENHTPHNADKFTDSGQFIHADSPLTGEAAEALDAVSQGVYNASEALGKLTDYFREQEQPTVLLFFGDHRPGLGLSDGLHTVYSQLGMCEDNREWFWTMDQRKQLYTTSYLIWSNDPDYLPAPAGTVTANSSNFLGLSILDAAGVERPLHWRILDRLSQTRLIDTFEYRLDRAGNVFSPSSDGGASPEELARMERYSLYLNDVIKGSGLTTQRLRQ